MYVVGSSLLTRLGIIFRTIYCPLHMYLDMSLWRTIQVVGTKYLRSQRHTVLTLSCERLYELRTIEQYIDITAYERFDITCCTIHTILLS